MTDRKLSILAITAVIMVGAAILQSRLAQRAGTSAMFQSSPLIQGLALDAITSITIASEKGEKITTLTKADKQFVVSDKNDYPANISVINTLLNNCLDIRTTEHITSDPANHADLGVTDQTARYAVRFFNADGKEITGVLISEMQSDPSGAFARLTTSQDVYFIQSPPWLSTGPMEYINSTLVEADRTKIRQVAVKSSSGEYILTSDGSDAVALEPMPEGKQFKGTTYKSVFGAMSSLRCEDVMADGKAPEGLAFNRSFVCTLDDTTVYTLLLAQKDEKTYAMISAGFLDKAPVEKERRVESEEELKKKEAKLLAIDAVESFNKRHKGWVYQIPSYKAGDLTKPLEELLEDKPAPAEATAESATPVAADPNAQ